MANAKSLRLHKLGKFQEASVGMAGCNKKPGDSVRQRRNTIQLAF